LLKTINTLKRDIDEVLRGKGGWDSAVSEFLSSNITRLAEEKFTEEPKPRNYLSLSMLGTPCKTKLWYLVNKPELANDLTGDDLGNFFYGDLLEVFAISLVMAAGHHVEGLQEDLEIDGVPGHGDVIIDGMVVDVKSASRFSFVKFLNNGLRKSDPFGYLSQLSSYLKAYEGDKRVLYKDRAAFLAIDKDRFKIAIDVYDLTEELAKKGAEVQEAKDIVALDYPPAKTYKDIAEGKAGNRVLDAPCCYCSLKNRCWDKLRVFNYANGPKFFTKVVKEPRVGELK
jgi:hypothetical protein